MPRMLTLCRFALLGFLVAALGALGSAPIHALQDDDAEAAEAAEPEVQDEIEDVIVVTASRSEQRLHEVPATISVLSAEQIERIPTDDFGDLLRNVPGLNVSQMSARDIQVTGRAASSSLASQELVLLDGRTLYLDFFGFVMWDYLPVNTREIKQVEVVRGPGSAVWGANAMSGVINLITKSPKEMVGTSVQLGGGELGTAFGSMTHAGVSGKTGYKISAGYYEQDPFDRPTGTIPGTESALNPQGTLYEEVGFENQGTKQPKADLRIDYEADEETIWGFGAGYAATDGIIHSGIGPFDIDSGSTSSFVRGSWTRRAMKVNFFANLLDGEADNLLAVGVDGQPINFGFKSDTFNLDFSDTRILGSSANNILSYGANVRQNQFELSIAPEGDDRQEYGVYLQDEILLGDKFRWVVGARWDDIDPIGSVVSPRTSIVYAPHPNHSFRASFNRAFKAPSMIQNYLDITILQAAGIPLDLTNPGAGLIQVIFPVNAVGNPGLTEEKLDAFEIGWVGTFDNRTTVSLAVYRNETTDSQDFFQEINYSSQFPPPGWPLPPFVLDILASVGSPLPAQFSYRNIGETIDRGVEFAIDYRMSPEWSFFFNYSWQDEPEISGIDKVTTPGGDEVFPVNIPPKHRLNLGGGYNGDRFFVNANVNYQDKAFWTDVLNFLGPTDAFTQVNLGLGVRFAQQRATLSINAQNVFDEDVQQHLFGDIISRKIIGQLQVDF